MNAYATSNDRFSRCVEEFIENAGAEIRHAAAYVDRVIVPEVRRETGSAARILAGHLERLAERLHPIHATETQNREQGREQGQ